MEDIEKLVKALRCDNLIVWIASGKKSATECQDA